MATATFAHALGAPAPLSTPTAQHEYKTRLVEVTTTLDSIQTYFEVVAETLASSSSTESLSKEWHALSLAYNKYRWETKESSAEIEEFIAELGNELLPQVPGYLRLIPGSEVERSLIDFQKRSEPLGQKSIHSTQNFQLLYDELEKFERVCEAFDDEHDRDVRNLQNEINDLQKQKEELIQKIHKREADLGRAKAVQKNLKQPKLIIDRFIEVRLKALIEKLHIFHDIWASGDLDITQLAKFVAHPHRDIIPSALYRYEDPGHPVYGVIRKALHIFAIGRVAHGHFPTHVHGEGDHGHRYSHRHNWKRHAHNHESNSYKGSIHGHSHSGSKRGQSGSSSSESDSEVEHEHECEHEEIAKKQEPEEIIKKHEHEMAQTLNDTMQVPLY